MDRISEGTTAGRAGPRRGWRFYVAIGAAGLGMLFVVVAGWKHLTFPATVARHPVRAEAVVTARVINGLGGDPAIEYRYTVEGRTYKGEGNGELGHEGPEAARGTRVAIEYAATDPSESCTCDAESKRPESMASALIVGGVLCLPLCILITRRRRRPAR